MSDSSQQQFPSDIQNTPVARPHLRHGHRRSRTTSLISSYSGHSTNSFRGSFDLSKADSATAVSSWMTDQDVSGSFVLKGSATASLKNLACIATRSSQPHPIPTQQPRRRRVTFISFSQDEEEEFRVARPVKPIRTRTMPLSSILRKPSSASSSSASLLADLDPPSDLHPILADMERKSKLCTKRIFCSTCSKPGSDYPRCGKCGQTWCSRECRLIGGKRHICPS